MKKLKKVGLLGDMDGLFFLKIKKKNLMEETENLEKGGLLQDGLLRIAIKTTGW